MVVTRQMATLPGVKSLSCRTRLNQPLSLRSISTSGSVSGQDNSTEQPQNQRTLPERLRPRTNIFSGIQPTGIPHLGNYLGALRQWKEFQDQKGQETGPRIHDTVFSIVDLHALTHFQNPAELLRRRRETLASLLAIGLNKERSVIFYQSEVWLFSMWRETVLPQYVCETI